MLFFLTRRLIFSVPVLIGVSIGIFVLMRVLPGDPVQAQAGDNIALGEQQKAELTADLGLDKPLVEQYFIWMKALATGSGGQSLVRHNDSLDNVWRALPVTLEITIGTVILGLFIAIPLGVIAAAKRNSWFDYGSRTFVVFGLSVPDFWIGTMILVYFAVWFKWTVPFGYTSLFEDPVRNIQQFGLPILVVGIRLSASTMRFTRAGMLEVLAEDYVRTARAKGLASRAVVMGHAFRNAMIPIVTVIGVQMAYLLGGTVVMETLFSLPGLGLLTVQSVRQLDYTQVQTNVMIFAMTTILINFLIDMTYASIDPRIRAS